MFDIFHSSTWVLACSLPPNVLLLYLCWRTLHSRSCLSLLEPTKKIIQYEQFFLVKYKSYRKFTAYACKQQRENLQLESNEV